MTKLMDSLKILFWKAQPIAQEIFNHLCQMVTTRKVEITGDFRRRLETIGELDFLVASQDPTSIVHWFTTHPWVDHIFSQKPSEASVHLTHKIKANIKIVTEQEFAFSLLESTGSKEHLLKLHLQAAKKAISLNDPAFQSEESIYKALELPFIPPEMREDRGEIESALQGLLPTLVEEKDIRGCFHCHTTDSDGQNSLEEMVHTAEKLGLEYIGISDHSKSSSHANGMDENRLFNQIERIKELKKRSPVPIFAGIECDILPSGQLDFEDSILKELDFVIISIHQLFSLNKEQMTARLIKAIENPYTTMVGHLTGRILLRRESYALDIPKVIDACARNKKIIELNGHPNRLDMDWRFWHEAKEKGVKCCINPDAHKTSDFQYIQSGINSARKGWLEKADVFNTYPLKEVEAYLKFSRLKIF